MPAAKKKATSGMNVMPKDFGQHQEAMARQAGNRFKTTKDVAASRVFKGGK